MHLAKERKRTPEMTNEFNKNKAIFETHRERFNLLRHPNVLPYQRLVLNPVFTYYTIESRYT